MVLLQQVKEPVQKVLALLGRDAVDVLNVPTNGEDALPAGDGVRPDDGVDGLEDAADVARVAARLVVQLEAVARGGLAEAGLLERDAEALEELLVRGAEAVVDLVAGRPEGI